MIKGHDGTIVLFEEESENRKFIAYIHPKAGCDCLAILDKETNNYVSVNKQNLEYLLCRIVHEKSLVAEAKS
jgi:hypothetical protein